MIFAWPVVKVFLTTYWKPLALSAGALLAIGWHQLQVNKAWHEGREALIVEQVKEAQRRNADAQTADAAARKCSADPACRLQDDGHRRD